MPAARAHVQAAPAAAPAPNAHTPPPLRWQPRRRAPAPLSVRLTCRVGIREVADLCDPAEVDGHVADQEAREREQEEQHEGKDLWGRRLGSAWMRLATVGRWWGFASPREQGSRAREGAPC
jgi:hypothetical protein